METNFKGTKGELEILEYVNDLEIGTLQSTLICTLPSKTDEYLANAQLLVDAFDIRQQINFDLPELLKQRNEMFKMLRVLSIYSENEFIPQHRFEEIKQLIKESNKNKL